MSLSMPVKYNVNSNLSRFSLNLAHHRAPVVLRSSFMIIFTIHKAMNSNFFEKQSNKLYEVYVFSGRFENNFIFKIGMLD